MKRRQSKRKIVPKPETPAVNIKQENYDDLEDTRTTSLFPQVFKCLVEWDKDGHQYFNLDGEPDKQDATSTAADKIWRFPL